MTTTELDERIEALLVRRVALAALINAAHVDALQDPERLMSAALLREEFRAIPAQIGELTRQRVLAHLAELRDQAAKLRAEYEPLVAEYEAAADRAIEWRKQRRKVQLHELGDLMRDGFELDHANRSVATAYELARARLQAVYTTAAAQYGCGLDGSDFQAWATGRVNNIPLPCDSAAWAAVAVKRGKEAARLA